MKGAPRPLAALSLALVLASPLAAADPPRTPAPAGASGETTTSWVIALTALTPGADMPPSSPFLTRLPSLLLSRLADSPPRRESGALGAERRDLGELSARFEKGGALWKSLDDRAALSLQGPLPWTALLEKEADLEATVDRATAELATALESAVLDTEAIPATSSLLPKLWKDGASLLEATAENALTRGRSERVDLVITGSAQPVGDYVEVRLRGFESALGRELFTLEGFASPDDPEPLADEFAAALEPLLGGDAVGRLDLTVTPGDAVVTVDGVRLTSLPARLYAFESRVLAISVTAPGTEGLELAARLEPGRHDVLHLVPAVADRGELRVLLTPDTARVTVAGELRGSGEALSATGDRRIARASAEGYESIMAVLPPAGPAEVAVTLIPEDGLGPRGRAEAARDSFYLALGLAALGPPAIRLADGLMTSYQDAEERAGGTLFRSRAIAASVGYYGAIGLTVAATVNALFALVDFLGKVR